MAMELLVLRISAAYVIQVPPVTQHVLVLTVTRDLELLVLKIK